MHNREPLNPNRLVGQLFSVINIINIWRCSLWIFLCKMNNAKHHRELIHFRIWFWMMIHFLSVNNDYPVYCILRAQNEQQTKMCPIIFFFLPFEFEWNNNIIHWRANKKLINHSNKCRCISFVIFAIDSIFHMQLKWK